MTSIAALGGIWNCANGRFRQTRRPGNHPCLARTGMTLVESLIVVAIVGLLLQLILPAIESSREAARRASCQNNLHNIGTAMLSHEAALGHLPTAGWGWGWMGDPDRGTGKAQPGSWAYQLLPYLDQNSVYEIGRGFSGEAKYEALANLASTPVSLLYCPSRRLPRATPNVGRPTKGKSDGLFWYNAKKAKSLARMDYVANVGDRWVYWGEGPPPLDADKGRGFFDFASVKKKEILTIDNVSGVVVQRQPYFLRQITDGTSHTCFVGEKSLFFEAYKGGWSLLDDQSCWNGDDMDTVASSEFPPHRDTSIRELAPPHIRVPFGSAHPESLNMLFCDGSVQVISYETDPAVFRAIGNRHDAK